MHLKYKVFEERCKLRLHLQLEEVGGTSEQCGFEPVYLPIVVRQNRIVNHALGSRGVQLWAIHHIAQFSVNGQKPLWI